MMVHDSHPSSFPVVGPHYQFSQHLDRIDQSAHLGFLASEMSADAIHPICFLDSPNFLEGILFRESIRTEIPSGKGGDINAIDLLVAGTWLGIQLFGLPWFSRVHVLSSHKIPHTHLTRRYSAVQHRVCGPRHRLFSWEFKLSLQRSGLGDKIEITRSNEQ